MKKIEILKRIGKVALQVAGVDAVAGDSDRAKMLEAQKELIELRHSLSVEALNDLYLATVEHVQRPTVLSSSTLPRATIHYCAICYHALDKCSHCDALSSSTLTRELAEAHAIITMLRERD